MAQVPYTPVPDVQPEDRVAQPPRLQIYTNPDMFGANIGRAIEQLGGTLQKSSEELFQRALAVQQIKNQAELDNLNSQFLNETAGVHANFSSLQGRNASDGLSKYGTDLEGIRSRIQSQASNPMVARLFESTSRNQLARDLFNGAGHAGQQLKVYQNDSLTGSIDAVRHSAGLSPFDEDGFQRRVTDATALVKDKAALEGLDPQDAVGKEVSKLYKERLVAMGAKDPFQATAIAKKAWDAGKIRSDDYAALDKTLQYQRNTTGARNISSGIFNGRNTMLGQQQIPIELAKKAIGGFESGDRYDLVGPPTHLGRALGRYQVMEAELPGQLKEAGLPPMTSQQFLRDPDAQDKLFSTVFGNLMEKYGNFNEAASRWFSGRSVAEGTASGVKDAFRTTVPKYLANVNAILAKNVPLSRLIDVGSRTADSVSDDPLIKDYTTQHITQDFNRSRAVEKDAIRQDKDTIDSAIQGEFTNGQIPKDPAELSHIPQVQQVIKDGRLSQRELLDMPGRLNRYRNSVAQKTDDEIANRLRGMADEEPLKFQAIEDFTQFPLSQKTIGEMQKLQRQKRASAEGDPDLAKAYRLIQPQLPNDFGDKAHEDVRHQFKGALQEALIWGMQQTGRKLKEDEIEEIGKRLLRQQLVPGWFTWITGNKVPSEPWYQGAAKVPEKERQRYIQQQYEEDESVPTDEQIRQRYIRDQFIKDFGKQRE